MEIKAGDKVRVLDLRDTGYLGTVLATNIDTVPNMDSPDGVYKFNTKRYAIMVDSIFGGDPDSTRILGRILYPAMNGVTVLTDGRTVNQVEKI
jgi:hypothetical protein